MKVGNSFFIICILLIIAVLNYELGNSGGIPFCTNCLIIIGVAIIVYLFNQQITEYKGWWIRPSNIVLLGLFAVNLQYIMDLVLGLKTYEDFTSPKTANICCAIGTIGILSYIAGNIAFNKRGVERRLKTYNHTNPTNPACSFLYFMQAATFVGWILSVDFFALVTGLTYADQAWEGGLSETFEQLFYNSTFTILIVKILGGLHGSKLRMIDFIKAFNVSFWLFVFLYLIIRLLSGDRGPFIYLIFALFYTYIFITHKKIPLRRVLLVGLLFSSLIIIVGIARSTAYNSTVSDRTSEAMRSFGNARFSDATVFVPTEELAYSFRCNEMAVNEINSGAPYHYGMYQIYALLNCIPFVPSYLYNTLKIPIKELSSDYYLTEAYFGDYYISGQIGTSIIAEFYLELGLLGVFIGMFIVGVLFKTTDSNICLNLSSGLSLIVVILTILYSSHAIYLPRSNFLSQMKPIVVIVIMFYLNKYISFKRRV